MFNELCEELLGNRAVFSRNDYKNGGRRYELIRNREKDLEDAVALGMVYTLEQIQQLQRWGSSLLPQYGRALREFRTPIRRTQRMCKSICLSILAPLSTYFTMMADRSAGEEKARQLDPARCYRMLEILDLAERRLKEASGSWARQEP